MAWESDGRPADGATSYSKYASKLLVWEDRPHGLSDKRQRRADEALVAWLHTYRSGF